MDRPSKRNSPPAFLDFPQENLHSPDISLGENPFSPRGYPKSPRKKQAPRANSSGDEMLVCRIYFFVSNGRKRYPIMTLILPGYMQKVKRSMDFILKKSIAKFSCRSKRFAKLVADVNICIVLKNERSLKKLLVKTKKVQ